MIKQFTVRRDDPDGIQSAVIATLESLGFVEPRVLVTRVYDREYNVLLATDEELTLKP